MALLDLQNYDRLVLGWSEVTIKFKANRCTCQHLPKNGSLVYDCHEILDMSGCQLNDKGKEKAHDKKFYLFLINGYS